MINLQFDHTDFEKFLYTIYLSSRASDGIFHPADKFGTCIERFFKIIDASVLFLFLLNKNYFTLGLQDFF